MTDVSVYQNEGDPKTYTRLANLLEYGIRATNTTIDTAQKYITNQSVIADFCCGIGETTKKIVEKKGGIREAILVDISPAFLKEAKKTNINAKSIITIEGDIVKVKLPKEKCDLVVSKFAYHHIPDSSKYKFVKQAWHCLKNRGVVIIADVLTDNVNEFYNKVLDETIKKHGEVPGLRKFLTEIRDSKDVEFKVSKEFADNQFKEQGFKIKEEVKVWPSDDSLGKNGVYVIVYWK